MPSARIVLLLVIIVAFVAVFGSGTVVSRPRPLPFEDGGSDGSPQCTTQNYQYCDDNGVGCFPDTSYFVGCKSCTCCGVSWCSTVYFA